MAAVLAPCWNCARGQTDPCRCWRSPALPEPVPVDLDALLDRAPADEAVSGR